MSIYESKPYVPLVTLNYNAIAYLSGQLSDTVKRIVEAVIMDMVDVIRAAHDLEIDFGVAIFRAQNRVVNVDFNKTVLESAGHSLQVCIDSDQCLRFHYYYYQYKHLHHIHHRIGDGCDGSLLTMCSHIVQ